MEWPEVLLRRPVVVWVEVWAQEEGATQEEGEGVGEDAVEARQ